MILEQDRTNDRVRRGFFDRIEMVLVWRTLPWVRMLIAFLLLGVPVISLLIWAPDDEVKWIVGGGLAVILLFIQFRYLYNRKTHILIRREDAEKSRNRVDKEGDAVMVVWKEKTDQTNNANKNNNRESGVFNLEVNSKTEANDDPVSPSPRAGGRDAWSERGEVEREGSQISFNVRGTIERRKKVYMGSKSGHIGRYRHSRERNADNSITQMAQMDDENISQASIDQSEASILSINQSQAVTQAGGCLTLHSKWKSQFDDSEASENETEMKGENLQSPEHKQGESPGTNGHDNPGLVSTTRALELSR